jgi:hypothetical protein
MGIGRYKDSLLLVITPMAAESWRIGSVANRRAASAGARPDDGQVR